MLILTIRTDKPEAELGLYEDNKQLAYHKWQAHRELAETIHLEIRELLKGRERQMRELEGLVFFRGSGSFTGLRIGASVANALSAGLDIPITNASGQDWQSNGIKSLLAGENDGLGIPEYGAEARTTKQKK